MSSSSLKHLLGNTPASSEISNFLLELNKGDTPQPEVKSYPDAVYFNYYPLGISLLYTPIRGYKPRTGLRREELDAEKLSLDSIDVYNIAKIKDVSKPGATRSSEIAFKTFVKLPIDIDISQDKTDSEGKLVSRPSKITISEMSVGKDFVGAMGEPDRKGGGSGPSSGSIGIWCEWSADGLMVEFGGDEARGPQAWERGKDAIWRVMTIFTPKSN